MNFERSIRRNRQKEAKEMNKKKKEWAKMNLHIGFYIPQELISIMNLIHSGENKIFKANSKKDFNSPRTFANYIKEHMNEHFSNIVKKFTDESLKEKDANQNDLQEM